MLHDLGHCDVVEASSADEATETLERDPSIGLVVCDHYMPGTDGIDFIHALKLDPRNAQLPCILMSSDHAITRVEQALESGADEYLIKPFDTNDLQTKLNLVNHTT